jgi:hypothetical protein
LLMAVNTKAFKRGIIGLVALEALSLVIVLTMNHEVPMSDVLPRPSDLLDNLRMPLFLLFVVPLNFPGLVLANKLGFFEGGGWNGPHDPHAVAGWILAYAVSLVFWAACIRGIARAMGGAKDSRKE